MSIERFDIAFGVDEHLIPFIRLFNDPPALMYKQFPDWLITDSGGKIIPMAQRGFAVSGAKRAMDMFLAWIPNGRIRFNLQDLTPQRGFTMQELEYILGTPALRQITVFYDFDMELNQNKLLPYLEKLSLKG